MKFSPLNWNEVKSHEEIAVKKGWLRLRVSAPCPLYLSAQGYEALAGVETAFNVEIAEEMTFRLDAPKGARAFLFVDEPTTYEPEGEVFTNIDRMVDQSGSYNEIQRALRQLEMDKRAMLRDMRMEHMEVLARVRAAPRAEEPDPVLEDAEPDA